MSLLLPVRYPAKHYSHLDAGAPQLANVNGAIKTILKACLVTGYGDKAGAGWTALFDDAFRIVLRRPLRTGNPPDVKIENGISNRHQIISQDNPTSITDTKKLASVPLLARDSSHGVGWHLIACDFGFVFVYQMSENGHRYESIQYDLLYVGGTKSLADQTGSMYASYHVGTAANGIHSPWASPFMSEESPLRNLRTNTNVTSKYALVMPIAEKTNNVAVVQSVFLQTGEALPFYCPVGGIISDEITSVVQVNGRSMLRVYNSMVQDYSRSIFYIPLDYWEL